MITIRSENEPIYPAGSDIVNGMVRDADWELDSEGRVRLSLIIDIDGKEGLDFMYDADMRGVVQDVMLAVIRTILDPLMDATLYRLRDVEDEPVRVVLKDEKIVCIGNFMHDIWLTADDVLARIKEVEG